MHVVTNVLFYIVLYFYNVYVLNNKWFWFWIIYNLLKYRISLSYFVPWVQILVFLCSYYNRLWLIWNWKGLLFWDSLYMLHNMYLTLADNVTMPDPVVGDLFALLSDEVWCRVQVTGVSGGRIQVFFVDHGDFTEASKSELRPLAPQFRRLPFQVA